MKEKIIDSCAKKYYLLFDDDDYDLIFNKLCINNLFISGGDRKSGHKQTFYVKATLTESLKSKLVENEIPFNKYNKKIFIHRIITRATSDFVVNHKNKNGLDNRKENLEVCTISFNNHDSEKRADNTSGVRGVTIRNYHNRIKYEASININKKRYYSQFDTMEEAELFLIEKRKKITKSKTEEMC